MYCVSRYSACYNHNPAPPRTEVLRRAAERLQPFVAERLGDSKVRYLDVCVVFL